MLSKVGNSSKNLRGLRICAVLKMFSRARDFSETFRAFPVSMLPGNERENVLYGGKSKISLAQYSNFTPILSFKIGKFKYFLSNAL